MAWLVCLKREDEDRGQYLEDIVEIQEDSQSFPDHYPITFHMLQINGTKADVLSVLKSISPQIYTCCFGITENKWTFNPAGEISGMKRVWRPANTSVRKWYDLVNHFKFPFTIGELTPEEKQLMQTYDINHPSITSFINKVSKNLTEDPANNVEETDLRNTLPPELI